MKKDFSLSGITAGFLAVLISYAGPLAIFFQAAQSAHVGREQMDEALQALCFAADANSIFYGDKLLTTSNPQADRDRQLFERLGLNTQGARPAAQPAQ